MAALSAYRASAMQVAENSVVLIHYTLTNDQGEVLDSSSGGEPLAYLHGADGATLRTVLHENLGAAFCVMPGSVVEVAEKQTVVVSDGKIGNVTQAQIDEQMTVLNLAMLKGANRAEIWNGLLGFYSAFAGRQLSVSTAGSRRTRTSAGWRLSPRPSFPLPCGAARARS